jgi:hypothetical protein
MTETVSARRLRLLARRGHGVVEIAARCGLSLQATRRRLAALGRAPTATEASPATPAPPPLEAPSLKPPSLKPTAPNAPRKKTGSRPRWSERDLEGVRRGVAAGLDDRAIGDHIGRSADTVARMRHRLGLFVRPRRSEGVGASIPAGGGPAYAAPRPSPCEGEAEAGMGAGTGALEGAARTDVLAVGAVFDGWVDAGRRHHRSADALDADTCRWIEGEPGEGACGAPRRAGSSYCAAHHARAYRGLPPAERDGDAATEGSPGGRPEGVRRIRPAQPVGPADRPGGLKARSRASRRGAAAIKTKNLEAAE